MWGEMIVVSFGTPYQYMLLIREQHWYLKSTAVFETRRMIIIKIKSYIILLRELELISLSAINSGASEPPSR
jgi:hypothetical protein